MSSLGGILKGIILSYHAFQKAKIELSQVFMSVLKSPVKCECVGKALENLAIGLKPFLPTQTKRFQSESSLQKNYSLVFVCHQSESETLKYGVMSD